MKFNKTNVTKLLIQIQDTDGLQLACNAIATKAIEEFGLEKLHQKLTNPKQLTIKEKIPCNYFILPQGTLIKSGDMFFNPDTKRWNYTSYGGEACVGDVPRRYTYIRFKNP